MATSTESRTFWQNFYKKPGRSLVQIKPETSTAAKDPRRFPMPQGVPGSEAAERVQLNIEEDAKVEDPKKDAIDGKDLVKFGQILLSQPQRLQPLAPKVVGQAAQTTPNIGPQFQPDPNSLAILSQLLGGR